MQSSMNIINNPTDDQRHEILRTALENAGRLEDYEYIIRYLSPVSDITNIAAPGELRGVKIGIIGGGLAGMASAYELRKLGADITILEASTDRIGGRVYTYYFDSNGKYYGEFGAMRIPISHETTWYYINLFGLNTISMASPKRNNFYYVHNTRIRTTDSIEQFIYPKYNLTPEERNTPWSTLREYANSYRFLQLPPEIRSELIRIMPEYSPDLIPLTEISLRKNYEALGLSQGAINLISGVDPNAGALLSISYAEIASDDYSMDFLNIYRIQNGMVMLPLAFHDSFKSKNPPGYTNLSPAHLGSVSYKTGHNVTGIYLSDYRNKVVLKYRNKTDGSDAADIFDYVICTIPLTALRTVEIKPYFTNNKMQAILEQYYVDAMKSAFLCNRRFWERNTDYGNIIGGISFTDLPIQSIIYPSDHNTCLEQGTCSSEEPGVLIASYNLAQNSTRLGGMSDSLRYETIRQNVEEVHGLPRGFINSFVRSHKTVHWNEEPLYRGAFALNLPGQKRLFAYELQQPEYNGRVYFAGEHVSAKHGWIQGALASGKEAANKLAEHFHGRYV
jgi:monoamine oxidase